MRNIDDRFVFVKKGCVELVLAVIKNMYFTMMMASGTC